MTARDQELMERYIYQVIRRLPKQQRDEVGLELRELITDMAEDGTPMEEILTRLGDPAEFAGKYRDGVHHLIGPEYYDAYLWFLKVVLICSVIPIIAVSLANGIREGIAGMEADYVNAAVRAVAYGLGDAVTNCIMSALSVFGAVTLIFAVLERQKVKIDLKQQKKWSVDDFVGNKEGWTPQRLAPVPHKKAVISRGDSIIGIVFIVIFGILLIFAPGIFAAVFTEDGSSVVIPVFNLARWNIVLPALIVWLLVGLTDEILRLVMGCYCKIVMYSNIICGVVQIVLGIMILKLFPFWNPEFGTKLKIQLGDLSNDKVELLFGISTHYISDIILIGIVVITLAEMAVTIYKTLRYGMEQQRTVKTNETDIFS